MANILLHTFLGHSICRLSTNTGIRAVDVGMPQLSMHSIREMMGCDDLTHAGNLFEAYFRDFRVVEAALSIDTVVS